MIMNRIFAILFVIIIVSVCSTSAESEADATDLSFLFDKLIKKQQNVKNSRLIDFINRGAPSGVDAPVPSIAEYETFRSDKSANFLSDGQGHIVFRQFRRIRISDLLGQMMHKKQTTGGI